MLSRKDYIRYSRQIMLPEMGESGQEKILGAKVLVIGLGGLGCPALQYLAGAGIGHMTIVDDDVVAVENLHRQLLYRETDLGEFKAEVAARVLSEVNPAIKIDVLTNRMSGQALDAVMGRVDVVLDCTDNIESRFEINRAAVKARIAHIVGSAIRAEGQIVSFDHSADKSPCFACVMTEKDASGMTCAESGVLGPALGVIGASMAIAALTYIAIPKAFIVNQWQFFDAFRLQWMTLNIEQNQQCSDCILRSG